MKNLFSSAGFRHTLLALGLSLAGTAAAQAQNNVGVGTASPDASAVLDVSSTTQGLLGPRMSQSQRNARASPATGLLVYQTDNTPGFYVYIGSAWTAVGGDGEPVSVMQPSLALPYIICVEGTSPSRS